MNTGLHESTAKEKAFKISYLLAEEIERELGRLSDQKVLEELRFMFYDRSEESQVKKVEKRMRELGFSYEPILG